MNEFVTHGFLVVKNFCSSETANLMAESLLMAKEVEQHTSGKYHQDTQVPNAYAQYAHFDYALRFWAGKIGGIMGKVLVPVNSYARVYENGNTLTRHSDRPELQYNISLCLKRDRANWAFGIKDLQGQEHLVYQEAGDALFYQGQLTHWREGAYMGQEQVQVFLHYCESGSEHEKTKKFDGRKFLGK